MSNESGTPRAVILRDLLLFQLKLFTDGLKDLVVAQAALVAAVLDLLSTGPRRGRWFYTVMRLSERFDLWLNLHGASARAHGHRDGLFGVSRAGEDTLLGKVEELVRGPEVREATPAASASTGGW